MYNVLTTILASVGAYLYVLILARFMGKKLISQMTFFDFIIAVTLGSLTANISLGMDSRSIAAAVAILILTLVKIALDYLHIKNFTFRKLTISEPTTLVSNGQIVEQNLKKSRIAVNELTSMLREKDVFSFADVEFAIMETNGQLSVLKKPEKTPLTPSSMNQPITSKGLTRDIIMDGILLEENLHGANLDKNWLNSQLKSQGLHDASEVFYAGVDNTNTLYISRKSNKKEKHGQYGIE